MRGAWLGLLLLLCGPLKAAEPAVLKVMTQALVQMQAEGWIAKAAQRYQSATP